jgi:hypothetical protein
MLDVLIFMRSENQFTRLDLLLTNNKGIRYIKIL